jgi:hypothetical protein
VLRHVLSPIQEEACEISAYLRKVGTVETLQSTPLDHVEQPLLPRSSFIPHEVTSELYISPSENVPEQHRIVKGREIAQRNTVEALSIAPSTRAGWAVAGLKAISCRGRKGSEGGPIIFSPQVQYRVIRFNMQ